ncbi:hypothetical protein APHAL10511_003236 [Amanita phalloides]|nr:hypothetical protein APHAL10511_003236 [Amanita phalloides]
MFKNTFISIPQVQNIRIREPPKYSAMPRPPLFRRKAHEGLPPSFLPSMVVPYVTANASTTIPSVGGASIASTWSYASQGALIHSSCSGSRDMAVVRIACRDWIDGEIFDWYRRQPYTTISKLELRKERDHFKHEYVIIYLDNGWYYRIERRPILRSNMEAISKDGCEADDSVTPITDADLAVIRSETDAEITLEFKSNKPDLYNAVAVAVAIHLDPQTKNYTLQQYNCYFVARSIIALVARHCLLQAPPMIGLRWDRVTESAIFNYIFGGDWNKLATVMKGSISTVLENLLWKVIKEDAGTRIEKRKDWNTLKDIARRVIHEEVEISSATLAMDAVQRAVNEWIIHATQVTLWYENLNQNLSERRYARKYETTAKGVLRAALQPELQVHLPDHMLKGLSKILPERLINRIPSAALAHLTPEILARLSATFMEKAPDDLHARIPHDVLTMAPAEFWQKAPVSAFSKAKDPVVLTLPEDLTIVPQEFLEISLQRMRNLLDQPKDHPDRVFALKLLRRLPLEHLAQLPSSYIAMRDSEADEELLPPVDNQTRQEQTSDDSVEAKPRRLLLGCIKAKWDEASFLGLLIRLAPVPVLKRIPSFVLDLVPSSSVGSVPTTALERLPNEFLAKVKTRHFEMAPPELLRKIPESVLLRAPRAVLERLPTSLLERLPAELIRKLPAGFFDNLPEDLTDQIRKVIQSSAFESEELKRELSERVKEITRTTLVTTSGELPATLIQVSVLTNVSKRTYKTLLKHEDLQKHILDMIRIHSKMVAQVPPLGMGEERVYSGLRTKTEEIWQVMRLHPSLPGHS